MARICVRKETGALFFDFVFRNIRFREQTNLKDTAANRKLMQNKLDRITWEIKFGQFDFGGHFPNSRGIKKLNATAQVIDNAKSEHPTIDEFTRLWFEESKVQWRKSYIESVKHILEERIMAFFKGIKVNEKNGNSLSPPYINRNMKMLRAILLEAADRYNFTSTYRGIKPLKVPKSHIQPFNLDEIQSILGNCRPDFREYYLIRFFTGMRTGEIDGL
jgi:integrase